MSTNEVYQEGDRMKRIKLGRTLRRISREGIETFYNGSLADQIIDEIQKKGLENNRIEK
jgi:gamma-glutamyltranspeptidase